MKLEKRGSTGEELAGGGVRSKIGGSIIGGGDEVGVDCFETTLRGRCGIHDDAKTTISGCRFIL